MPTTPYLPPPPTTQDSELSQSDYQWLLIVQGLAALYEVDTSKGSYTESLPAAGVASSGQTGQGKEIIYFKTSADGNTYTLKGAATGTVTLTAKWQFARFKSDGTNWYAVGASSSGSALAIQIAGVPTSNQSLLDFIAGSGITITNPSGGQVEISATGGGGGVSGKWSGNWGGWSIASSTGIGSAIPFQYGVNWENFNVAVTNNGPTATEGRSYSANSGGGNNCFGYDETAPSSTSEFSKTGSSSSPSSERLPRATGSASG